MALDALKVLFCFKMLFSIVFAHTIFQNQMKLSKVVSGNLITAAILDSLIVKAEGNELQF